MQENSSGNRPALEVALQFMRELLASGHVARGDRLPTSRVLATRAGVSPNTMLSALRMLAAEGAVSLRRSRGIMVGPDPTSVDTDQLEQDVQHDVRWRRLASQLRREIMSGPPGQQERLPTVKQLCSRHAVCPATLRRAVRLLKDEGLLHEDRRGYRIRVPLHKNANAVGLVVGTGLTDLWSCQDSTIWETDFFRTLEAECLRRSLDVVTLAQDRLPVSSLTHKRTAPELLGLIASRVSVPLQRLAKVHEALGKPEIPTAVFDLDISKWQPELQTLVPSLGVFAPSQRRAGKAVGRYLWQLGHTEVCYVCPYHENTWSHDRLVGVRQAFAEGGARQGAVTQVTREGVTVRLGNSEMVDSNGIGLIAQCSQLSRRLNLRSDACGALRGTAAAIEETVRLREAMGPLVQQALQTNATAWVVGNDRAALTTLSLLQERGIDVPENVNVISFDDTVAAFHHNLSSYSFEIGTYALRALNFVTYRRSDTRSLHTVESIPGLVVPRSTTAPPRR